MADKLVPSSPADASEPLFSFGVIADIQYADLEDGYNYQRSRRRYYRHSLIHLQGAIEDWNKESSMPCCVLQLGDIIDGYNAQYKVSEKSLELVMNTFQMLKVPVHHTWGNHEFYNFSRDYLASSKLNSKFLEDQIAQHPETTPSENYYAYHFVPFPKFRFILLDSYDLSVLGIDPSSPKYEQCMKMLREHNPNVELNSPQGMSMMECSEACDTGERTRATLIICPLSVLSNWIDQFGQHVKSEVHLNFYVYYGPDRIRDSAWLSKQDIILTTYNILTHDYGTKDDSPLHSIKWLRVILDEGHAIRNPNAQQTKAVLELEAERRWVLTGSDTPEELRKMLIEKMKIILSSGSDEECAICLDSLTFPVITHCAHVFCKPCICQVIHSEQPHAKCPLCRNEIHGDNLLECPPEELACDSDKESSMEWKSSSKINALMHALIELRTKDPNIKSLVVSQFTTFLSLIETPLKASGFVFTRLDGSMAQKKRVESIQRFQNTEAGSPTIMLLSLKAGGVGLNLCAASRVFLMDPAWNPAAEDQCFDRCHRLGQKQEVIITKFIVKDSVEENMLKIQNTKRDLAAGAFGTKKTDANDMKQAKINEIRTLIDL